MTTVRAAKLKGVKLRHEFTFLSIPGLQALFDPGRGVVLDATSKVQYWNDLATGKQVLQSVPSNRPTMVTGQGGFPAMSFTGGQRIAATSRAPFNFLHQGRKIAVFTVIKPVAAADNLASTLLGTTTNSATSYGFHITLDDRTASSRNNALISGILKNNAAAYASFLFNNSTTDIFDFRLLQVLFRGVRTGNDFELYVNKTFKTGVEVSGSPASTFDSSSNFSFGASSAGQANHENYLTVMYDWNDATDSEYETRRLLVESLIYQKFNVNSTVLPLTA